MNSHIARSTRGFSLIEVLIAVVILSVGLLALASLQIGLIRASSESKTQTIALNLAKDKLEDLASYRLLNEPTNTCVAANDSYQCITDGNDTLNDVGGNLGGVNFTREWTVQRCTVVVVSGVSKFDCTAADTAAYTGTLARNEFKRINVKVSWVDAAAGPQSVAVRDAVGALQPSDVALLYKKSSKVVARSAKARIYDPSTEAGVIPIAIGNGTNSAATNPKPEVVVGQNVVETRFDVQTYSGLNNGIADAQFRVETAVVGCQCDTTTKPAEQDPTINNARSKRPTYWNGFRYVVPEDSAYVPPAGVANVTQSVKCKVCCSDHHDSNASVTADMPKFSPYVTTHAHYNSFASGAPVVTSGVYREACRLIRVDGLFRVAADMKNEYFGLLATADTVSQATYATLPQPDATATTGYRQFVVDYMDARYTNGSPPSPANSYTGYNDPTAVDPSTLEVKNTTPVRDLNAPTPISLRAGDVKWLHSRGLYMDYLEAEALDAIAAAKLEPSCSGSAKSACILALLPFTSINLTEIADWLSVTPAQAIVTNNDYSQSAAANDPVRAKVVQGNSPSSGTNVTINSVSRKTNSGLLDLSFDAISPSDAVSYTDGQVFRINGSIVSNPNGGTFNANLTMPSGFIGTPAVSYKTGSNLTRSCNAGSPSTNNTCTVIDGSATEGLGMANTMAVVIGNYNSQVEGESTATVSGCVGPSSNFPIKAYTPANNDAYVTKTCKTYRVLSATNITTGAAATGSSPFTVDLDGYKAEKTTIAFPLISSGNVIGITFEQQSSAPQTNFCAYTCSQYDNAGTDCASANKTNFAVTSADCD